MAKNEMIVVNSLWKKISNFFKKLFVKKEDIENIEIKVEKNEFTNVVKNQDTYIESIVYRDEIKDLNRKKELARKMIDGKQNIDDLSENEIDEMIIYFKDYIAELNNKIERGKETILNLKRSNSTN